LLRATVAAGIAAGATAQAGEKAPAGIQGRSGAAESLRCTPLCGNGLDEALPHSLAQWHAEHVGKSAGSAG
jgi:hypothetical protein